MAKTTTAKPKATKRATKKKASAADTAASRNGTRPARRKLTTEEITLRAFRKVYEQHHRKTA